MAEAVEADEAGKGKKSGLILTIAAILVVSLLGAGGGWVVGGMLAPQTIDPAAEAAKAAEAAGGHGKSKKEGEEGVVPARPTLLPLDPIMTNLSYPSDNWIRIEVSLEFRDQVDMKLAEVVNEDILAYLRTVSLQQLEGPRGFQYLREDLVERARMRSEGRVTDVIFRTFVIE